MNKKSQRAPNIQPPGKKGMKNFGFVALLVLFGLIIYTASVKPQNLQDIPLSQVIKEANDGQYKKISVKGDTLEITKTNEDKATLSSRKDSQASLKEEGVDYSKVEVVN